MKFSEWYNTIAVDKDAQGNWRLPLVNGDFDKWFQCLDYIMSKLTPDPHLKDVYYFNADIGRYCFFIYEWLRTDIQALSPNVPTLKRRVNTVAISLETEEGAEILFRMSAIDSDFNSVAMWPERQTRNEKYIPDDVFYKEEGFFVKAAMFGPTVWLDAIVQACEDTLEQKFSEAFGVPIKEKIGVEAQ